jgi:hypothetical protein
MAWVCIGPGMFLDGESCLHVYPDLVRLHLEIPPEELTDAEIGRIIQQAYRHLYGEAPIVHLVEPGEDVRAGPPFNRPDCDGHASR